jgi:hypothetical protein
VPDKRSRVTRVHARQVGLGYTAVPLRGAALYGRPVVPEAGVDEGAVLAVGTTSRDL